jgi:agmatinase
MSKGFTWTGVSHAGVASFMRAPVLRPVADELRAVGATHAVYGIPFDSTTISRTGSNMGPRAIRDACSQFISYHFDYDIDVWDSVTLVDCGDAAAISGSAAKTFATVEEDLAQIYEAGAMPIVLGGDHSITIPATRALARAMDGPLGFVLFDAHMDTSMEMGGEVLTNCAPVSRAAELPQFSVSNFVLIGIHGPVNPRDERDWVDKNGVRMYTMHEIEKRGIDEVTREAIEIAWRGAKGVYVSVDIDCLDTAYAPGTSTPEPGGLTARELLRAMAIIGEAGYSAFDVAEIAPQYDLSGITARTACRVIIDLLAAAAASNRAIKEDS